LRGDHCVRGIHQIDLWHDHQVDAVVSRDPGDVRLERGDVGLGVDRSLEAGQAGPPGADDGVEGSASELVRNLEPETLELRSLRVVKRRLISQSPKARSASTELGAVLAAAAWTEQTPLPAGPPSFSGEAAAALPPDAG